MSDPSFGLIMLGLIVVAIMMGYPTAFTLMGLGMVFGFLAFWIPGAHWYDNRVFDLIAQRTYGVMTNDTLLSVPLFVFMGYVMERAALVDRMFHSVQLAFRRVPASLAVTTLLVCAFWGIASGIVGAVVVLMGVIALRPMLKAGYDVRLASGAITAGGTLGILIPPSVMLIVYAAVAGQSIVKLYAAAMLPGFFLTFLYLVYILGWAIINPKIAPKLAPDEYRVAVPEALQRLERGPQRRIVPGLLAALVRPSLARTAGYRTVLANLAAIAVPVVADRRDPGRHVVVRGGLQRARGGGGGSRGPDRRGGAAGPAPPTPAGARGQGREAAGAGLGGDGREGRAAPGAGLGLESRSRRSGGPTGKLEEMSSAREAPTGPAVSKVPANFVAWFWGSRSCWR